jgi:autotransporter-associated beta strand protein
MIQRRLMKMLTAAALAVTTVAPAVWGANGNWTNAPTSGGWTNALNWIGGTVPGTINNTGNNGTDNTSIALFTNAITTFGGVASPVIPDDATIANGKARMLGQINFDGPNCGAYVFSSTSPYAAQDANNPETGVISLCVGPTTGSTNGSFIGAAVTTPQTFLIPVQIRLPSSTDGTYGFTNNATSPLATYFFNNLFLYPGGTSRGVTFVFEGSNTGTNTVATLAQSVNQSTGNTGIRKQGAGRWILSGANTFKAAAPLSVLAGTLEVKDPGAFGLANTVTVTNSVLQIDGVSLNTAAITLQNNGTNLMVGSGTVNGITVANVLNTSAYVATTSASDVLTIGNTLNKITGGAVTTTLNMSGPGTMVFPFANNYLGKYSLNTGTNQLADLGALGSAANYNLNAGTVLDVTPLTVGGTYTLTAKAISANGTGTGVGTTASAINIDPTGIFDFGSKAMTLTYSPATTNGDLTHPVIYAPQGALSFNGNAITVVNAASQPLNAGTYKIVQQAGGTITSSGAFVTIVLGNGLVAGMVGEIVASGNSLNLLVYPYTPKGLVWTGNDPLLPGIWDRQVSTNFLNGATPSVFNIYDTALFNATGIAQPTVTLASTLVPGGVTVDTSAGDYTLTGSGQIAGGTTLLKKSAGTLNLNTANTYSGGTVVSNGVIKVGIDNAIPSTGLGDVTNVSPAVIDLNGFADTIGALNGNGTIDITSGGSSVLSVGANDNSGTFSGVLTNSSGTLGLTKVGLGTQTLTRSNAYTGTTDIELGTLKPTDPYSFGPSAAVVVNGGTLDMATNVFISSLAGAGGTIANNSTTTTNTLTVQGTATTSFAGSIVNSSGKVVLKVLGGSLRMMAANTYTNGTIVGSRATFLIHNSPAAVTGPLIASNTATLGLSGGSSSPGTPTTVTTVDGGTVTFTSGAEGEIWGSQFLGSATTTNRFTQNVSVGGIASFSNFLGTVQIALASGSLRFFNGGGVSGGDNTIFEFISGNVHTRDAQTVSLGYVKGGSSTCGIGGNGTATAISSWLIGAKNLDCSFQGYISGSNSLVKVGTGKLVLDGATVTTNTDSATYTNYTYASLITYANNTTVSNGVLALAAPNDLSNSPLITLAATNAVLDASSMGYVSNFTDVNGANAVLVTNGTLTIAATTPAAGTPQVLAGFGIVKGSGVTNNGTINPGSATLGGTLSISNSLAVNAGATNYFDLSDDLTGLVKPSDMIVVQGDVNLTGNSVIGIGAFNGVVKVGKYPLIKYGGSLRNESGVIAPGTTSIANLSLGGIFTSTSRATMVLSNAPGELDLVVVSLNTKNLTWTGDGVSNLWDVVTSYNWTSAATPIQFYQLDFVTFDNTATNFNVSLQGTVVPSGITVNSSSNYVFSTPGTIGGVGALIKTGTGSLLLTNGANSYTGGTVISNGLLSVGTDSGNNQNDGALGFGPITVAGGELRFGGNGGNVVTHVITNTIVLNGGSIKAQDGEQRLTNATVTVAAGGGSLVTVFATKNLSLYSPLIGTGNVTVSAVPAGTNVAGGQVILNNATNTISGAVIIATNGNLALIGAAGISNSVTIDVQSGGVLDVTARTGAILTLGSGQTLKGNGVLRGNLTTLSGSTLAPGASAIGTLIVTNAVTTVTLGGNTIMEINRSATQTSDRLLATTNIFGGTLTVNNLGAALQLGDNFTLFTSVTNRGAFAVTNLPALASGLGWSNSLAINGKLTVVNVVNQTPTNLVMSVSGSVLSLSWPADHTGWRLQVQTNALTSGLGTNWVTVPGSSSFNSTNQTINPANGAVFYRLVYP